MAADSEVRRLQQRIADLELQLAESRRSEIEVREERDLERLRSALSPGAKSDVISPVKAGIQSSSLPPTRNDIQIGTPSRAAGLHGSAPSRSDQPDGGVAGEDIFIPHANKE